MGAKPTIFQKGPRVLSIPTGVSFADALASHLLVHFSGDPAALGEALVLVPNRRGVLSLRHAFLKATGGKPTILPRLLALGDIEGEELSLSLLPGSGAIETSLPPAISSMEREILLTQLIPRFWNQQGMDDLTAAQSAALAKDLARFLDSVHTEGIAFKGLEDLVDDDLAEHWQKTTTFLKIITENWPKILADLGKLDPAKRRAESLRLISEQWHATPPHHPIIIAGSTGSLPQTANLMKIVSRLDHGLVVLPGLDQSLSDEAWEQIEKTPTHPQFTMRRALETMQVSRHEVTDWPLTEDLTQKFISKQARVSALQRALWPAKEIGKWREGKPLDARGIFKDFSIIPCPGPREEAGSVALMMREALEREGETVALITPDRSLARRVRAELDRWGLKVDDSAGTPLAETPIGSFLCLIGEAIEENLSPIPLLALLKHPFSTMGFTRKAHLKSVRDLELALLRGPRPAPGIKGLRDCLSKKDQHLLAFINQFEKLTSPLIDAFNKGLPLNPLITTHIEVAEGFAQTPEKNGDDVLWAGDAGNSAANFISEFLEASSLWSGFKSEEYPALFKQMMAGLVVRQTHSTHPRAFIWGTVEARMQQADTVILGGMNEDSWPPKTSDDPWMSRPMRARFGLPAPEVRIGLSAHDFLQSTGADKVIITRAEKLDNAETVPSRWLLRLKALLVDPLPKGSTNWLGMYGALDKPISVTPCDPPKPTPPLSARPKSLYVTGVETWMSDPYALYAKYILNLRPLDELDQRPGAAQKGSIIHDAFDKFSKRLQDDHKNSLPHNAFDLLIEDGKEAFGLELERPGVWAFWWPRFTRSAEAFILNEGNRKGVYQRTASEKKGSTTFSDTKTPFTLNAKADRIDTFLEGNSLSLIDYKTGSPPRIKEILSGYKPQMPLEGVIAKYGGFGLDSTKVHALEFWKISGDENPIQEINPFKNLDLDDVIDQAEEGLKSMINVFANPDTPYLSNPRPAFMGWGDYDHLARVKEWLNKGGDDV